MLSLRRILGLPIGLIYMLKIPHLFKPPKWQQDPKIPEHLHLGQQLTAPVKAGGQQNHTIWEKQRPDPETT